MKQPNFTLLTERLHLSELKNTDGPFIYELFNDPDCINFIGDRGIRNSADAQAYLNNKLIDSYHKHGFGLYKVTLKGRIDSMGICGLVKRDETKPPDIGFAFLPAYRSGGYCTEAAAAVLEWAKTNLNCNEILAYTNPDNVASIRVLEKIGLEKQSITTLPGQDFKSLILSVQFD